MDEWMDRWIYELIDGWIDDGWTDMNEWMDGWMDGDINEWMDGWMDG